MILLRHFSFYHGVKGRERKLIRLLAAAFRSRKDFPLTCRG